MKKVLVMFMLLCLLLVGCGDAQTETAAEDTAATEETTEEAAVEETTEEAEETEEAAEDAATIAPLPDTTMDNLDDAILAVNLVDGAVFEDEAGVLQMDVIIYTYDKYDMVDISNMKVGDTLVRSSGEEVITALEQHEDGTICVNGGLDEGHFDLATEEDGVFFEKGFNDAKNWYAVGEATIPVSKDFAGVDSADPELGDVTLTYDSLLTGEDVSYDFEANNTTIRVAGGEVVELTRVYIP